MSDKKRSMRNKAHSRGACKRLQIMKYQCEIVAEVRTSGNDSTLRTNIQYYVSTSVNLERDAATKI